jgi:phosphatidylserine/phosphatidylglycerophosphate/cardiolipin synthase-like enzyme
MNPALRTIKQPFRVAAGLLFLIVACWTPTCVEAFEDRGTSAAWQVYFSPDGGCTQAIVEALAGARQQILVQAYEMTSPQIKSALLAAHRRGVQVNAIFDPEALKESTSMIDDLNAGGIPIFIDSFHRPGIAHNKVMVIDQALVITGSFNFTRAAETRNAENLLLIRDPALAAAYGRNFNAHMAHSSELGAAETPAPSYHRRYYHRHYYRHSFW